MSIMTEEAHLKMEAARYTSGNKGFTHKKYLTTHLQAYVLMEQNPALSTSYSEFHKKDLILKGITCPKPEDRGRGCPLQAEMDFRPDH